MGRNGAPCQGCQDRVAQPNCHMDCEAYQAYNREREELRREQYMQSVAKDIRIRNAEKIRREVYRCTLKRRGYGE